MEVSENLQIFTECGLCTGYSAKDTVMNKVHLLFTLWRIHRLEHCSPTVFVIDFTPGPSNIYMFTYTCK